MLGILLGTDDGLLQIVPGERSRRALEGLTVTTLDYHDGIAVAGIPGRGVWVHVSGGWERFSRARGSGWQPLWEGDPDCVRVAPAGEIQIGAAPAALFGMTIGMTAANELGALRGALQTDRDRRPPTAAARLHVTAIAYPDRGPDDTLFVAVAGSGVWYSPDTGRNFEKRSDGLSPALNGLWTHPERPDRLFASTASGFYRSEDTGLSWVQSVSGLDRSWAAGLAVLVGTPDVLLLSCARREPGEGGALFRSQNGGVNWTRIILGDDDEWARAPLIARLWNSKDTVFVAAGDRLWATHDAGRTWLPLAEGLPPAHALAAAL